ncbi:MAG: hypothetical protein P1V20_28230 [Verrucomicrobiales bacterium]|nr:hypothetical protein [Verrucomicrobiales bacterium]
MISYFSIPKGPVDSQIEKLIDAALNKAVRASGPVKLYHGKYDEEGLFAKRNGVDRKAAIHGFGTEPPLWSEEPRSSTNHVLLVRLEPGGLERLVEQTNSAARKKLIESASELYRRELLERWSDLAAFHKWESDFPDIAEVAEGLIDGLQKLVPASSQPPAEKRLNGDEADFKRRMAHELVIAWKYAPTAEAKQSIANALKNSGIQQIGKPGEQLSMDGGLHRCEGPAFPGDPVEVAESGWLVHDGVGEFLLEKAIVKLI